MVILFVIYKGDFFMYRGMVISTYYTSIFRPWIGSGILIFHVKRSTAIAFFIFLSYCICESGCHTRALLHITRVIALRETRVDLFIYLVLRVTVQRKKTDVRVQCWKSKHKSVQFRSRVELLGASQCSSPSLGFVPFLRGF